MPFYYGDGHPINSKDNPGIFITKCLVSVDTQLIYNTGPQSTFSKTADRKSWILKVAWTYIRFLKHFIFFSFIFFLKKLEHNNNQRTVILQFKKK